MDKFEKAKIKFTLQKILGTWEKHHDVVVFLKETQLIERI